MTYYRRPRGVPRSGRYVIPRAEPHVTLVPEDPPRSDVDIEEPQLPHVLIATDPSTLAAQPVASDATVGRLSEWGVDEGDVVAMREAAVEAVAWKLLDRTSDLADRWPGDEMWRAAIADARTALPHLTAQPAPEASHEDVAAVLRPHVLARRDGLFDMVRVVCTCRNWVASSTDDDGVWTEFAAHQADALRARFVITERGDR